MAIVVESVRLTELQLKVHPEHAQNLNFNISFTCNSNFPEPSRLVQTTEFDLARDLPDAPFVFKFTYESSFRSDGVGSPTLEQFAEANAPAYVIPYARELIANVTARLGVIPTLVLPPINVFRLIEEAKRKAEEPKSEDQ